MIKFDLHIHSYASKYKEGKSIVDNSTIENAEVLMDKLNEQGVGLFSITDHNRFWPELYMRLDALISSGAYPNVKGLLAGVEFDVRMDPEMDKCHIITIFNTKNIVENYKRIRDVIDSHLIEDKNGAYSKTDFELILRNIGLDVILIACQRSGLDRHKGKHNSLSESTMDSEQLLMTGYINALEFQKPNVEGILRNNLKEVPSSVLLVMGSDCHDWAVYPNHDATNMNPAFQHSRAKILPTFKGLLMAVSSPETRINTQDNRNRDYISSFKIGGIDYPLVNGINAIIGENGSGKSTILKLLNANRRERHAKDLMEKNGMLCDTVDSSKRLYIGQGDIVSKFEKNKLFPLDNFIDVDNNEFKDAYCKFAYGILDYIKKRIKAKDAIDQLVKETMQYNDVINESNYFISLVIDTDYSDVENEHTIPNRDMGKLLNLVSKMIDDTYYSDYEEELVQIYDQLVKIYAKIHLKFDKKDLEKKVKNSIISAVKAYDGKVHEAATSRENDRRDYLSQRQKFVEYIVDAIIKNTEGLAFPESPKPISGFSTNPMFGFSFNSESMYHNKSVVADFLSQMFVRDYANLEKLKQIETVENLKNAVKGCTDVDNIESKFQGNLTTFLEQMCDCKNYIVDTAEGEDSLGNTLGEMSLAYFKYMVEQETERSVFLIDQPEDHISNNNISKKLLSYFNSIRNKKQIIIVTHNPLLVVNQDVDHVIFVRKKGDKIGVISGCLEQEGESGNILDIVASNMDGGKDSIEKRLRVYG